MLISAESFQKLTFIKHSIMFRVELWRLQIQLVSWVNLELALSVLLEDLFLNSLPFTAEMRVFALSIIPSLKGVALPSHLSTHSYHGWTPRLSIVLLPSHVETFKLVLLWHISEDPSITLLSFKSSREHLVFRSETVSVIFSVLFQLFAKSFCLGLNIHIDNIFVNTFKLKLNLALNQVNWYFGQIEVSKVINRFFVPRPPNRLKAHVLGAISLCLL